MYHRYKRKASPQYDDVLHFDIKHPRQVHQILNAGQFSTRHPLIYHPGGSKSKDGSNLFVGEF